MRGSTQEEFKRRAIVVNGETIDVLSHDRRHLQARCNFLTPGVRGGFPGCGLWPNSPLECQAAPQSQLLQIRPGRTYLLKKPFSRAWRFKETAQCQFLTSRDLAGDLNDDLGILYRYQGWAEYLGISTFLPELIEYLVSVRDGWFPPPKSSVPVWERSKTVSLI